WCSRPEIQNVIAHAYDCPVSIATRALADATTAGDWQLGMENTPKPPLSPVPAWIGREGLRESIREALNRHSAENGSDTADGILATFLMSCLAAFDTATLQRQ